MFGAEHKARFFGPKLCFDARDRKQKSVTINRLSGNLSQKTEDKKSEFRSMGVVFSLTSEGHIYVLA